MHGTHTTRCCVVAMAIALGVPSAPTQRAALHALTQQQIAVEEQNAGVQPMALPTEGLPPAYQGMPFFASVMALGGVGPYKVIVDGNLPPGIIYQPGVNVITLNGVPTVAGLYNAQFTVIDAYGAQVSRAYSMEVRPISRITPSPALISDPEAVHITDADSVFFAAVINLGEAVHITDGMMDFASARLTDPEAVHINDTTTVFLAVQYGLPEAMHITDTTTVLLGAQIPEPEAVHITDTTTVVTEVGVSPATAPGGTINVAYSQAFTAVGNTGAATVTPVGTLPTGMSFTTSGGTTTLHGTPTQAGMFNFTITAKDTVHTDIVSYSLVINTASQTITIGTLPTPTYGGAPFTLTATASPSGLPVTIASTSALATGANPFTPAGAGSASFTATQAGNANYSTTTLNFNVSIAPATLSVTAANASRAFDQPNPSFSYNFGTFVNGDTASAVSGAPAFSTTATPLSPMSGNPYTITPSTGTLNAANYTFNFVAGTLTVQLAAQTITFDPIANLQHGSTFLLSARSSSGLPVSYSVSGGSITNNILTVGAAGPVSVTASQAGNGNYSAANSVTRSFTAQ